MTKKQKNERVIHTRVPELLDSKLKDQAEGLGISVSKLIRHVLSNTFDLVDDIVADSAEIARSSQRALSQKALKGEKASSADADTGPQDTGPQDTDSQISDAEQQANILAWQPVVLNLNAICLSCNSILPKGTQAYLGVTHTTQTNSPIIMCEQCTKELDNESTADDHAE